MIRHAIRVAVATSHLTSARDLPEVTISHAAGHGLPIKDNLRPVIARRGPMTGAANLSEHPKEDGFPSEHPREDGSRRPPAADGDRQHHLAVGGSSGVEGSAWPLVPLGFGFPDQFRVSLRTLGFRWSLGVPGPSVIPITGPKIRRLGFLLAGCASSGPETTQNPHLHQNSVPWGSKLYNYRDWPCRGDVWAPLTTFRTYIGAKLVWAF